MFKLFRSVRRYSDEELLTLYRDKHDPQLVAELFVRYGDLISGLCLKYLCNTHDAEDAASHIYESMLYDLKKTEVRRMSVWLYSVTRNHCLKVLKQRRTELPHESSSEHFMELESSSTLSEKQELERRIIVLEHGINSLKDEQRQCIELFYLKHMSYQDISDSTGINLKKVKSHIQNGKRNLKLLIEQQLEKQ